MTDFINPDGHSLDGAAVQEYLDNAITNWRAIVKTPGLLNKHDAECYVDAFQSVRTSLFGELLP